MPDQQELSDRELEILKLVATGVSNKEIAQRLYISTNTVKVHLKNIFSKIGAASRTEAAMYAVKVGLVPGLTPVIEETENNVAQPEEVVQAKSNIFIDRWYWFFLIGFIVVLVISIGTYAYRQQARILSSTATPIISSTPSPFPRWREKASMLTPRKSMAVVAYENQIYAMGGESESGISNVVEKYDLATDSWSKLTPLPTPLSEINSVVIGGLIYIPGGKTLGDKLSQTLQVYDPRHDQWDELAPLPMPLCGYALAAYEGKLYLFGGWDGVKAINTVWEYDPVSDGWKERTAMPTARAYAGAAIAGGKIFVVGGFDGEKGLDVNEEYFPDLDNEENQPWNERAPLPDTRYGMGVASMADIIHVFGGIKNSGDAAGIDKYYIQLDKWDISNFPISNLGAFIGITPLETQIFIIGGEIDKTISNQTKSYQAIFTISIPLLDENTIPSTATPNND